MTRRARLMAWLQDARTTRRVNGVMAVVALALTPPAVLWWRSSLPYLVFISQAAWITGHWAGWQAARVEERQVEAEQA